MKMKKCSACREEKSLDGFHNNRRNADGKQSKCKGCFLEYQRVNPEKFYDATKRWRKANREYVNACARAYYHKYLSVAATSMPQEAPDATSKGLTKGLGIPGTPANKSRLEAKSDGK